MHPVTSGWKPTRYGMDWCYSHGKRGQCLPILLLLAASPTVRGAIIKAPRRIGAGLPILGRYLNLYLQLWRTF